MERMNQIFSLFYLHLKLKTQAQITYEKALDLYYGSMDPPHSVLNTFLSWKQELFL